MSKLLHDDMQTCQKQELGGRDRERVNRKSFRKGRESDRNGLSESARERREGEEKEREGQREKAGERERFKQREERQQENEEGARREQEEEREGESKGTAIRKMVRGRVRKGGEGEGQRVGARE